MFFRKLSFAAFAGMSLACVSSHALAAGPKPVKPLQGYKCLAIDAPDSVMMDFNNPIPLRSAPNDHAPVIAPAAAILAVNDPEQLDNGYVKSMNFAFKPGWVPTKWLKEYSEVHPGNTCAPYIMNDGKLGFKFGH
ncbi:hypothetical protein [Acetobacter ascendens]|uniref:SH3b domain-containing protein n=1 Tax=Acetobacter ascendens TaxID=481146 RepID=A0A1Y0V914_9PROT|nr:hypothetical protein [Acetobacter ascendens]ARW12158.1 hypothetical protein S101447_03121 [Acetobacter ascendens]